jgi:hypothetical protein
MLVHLDHLSKPDVLGLSNSPAVSETKIFRLADYVGMTQLNGKMRRERHLGVSYLGRNWGFRIS